MTLAVAAVGSVVPLRLRSAIAKSVEKNSLLKRLPDFHELSSGNPSDLILDRFLGHLSELGIELYPAQEEAILALLAGQHVILNTPTGSGKSLVAEALIFQSMSLGKRSVYTCPVKALVNEKFLNLCRLFGAESVGLMTGDGSVNHDAPILCCTAEVLTSMALCEGEDAKVDDVIMDEFHYYSDRERGMAWQVPLLELRRARFLLMSATLGDMSLFEKDLKARTGRDVQIITGLERPVPLEFEYRGETHLHETIQDLLKQGKAPIYLVNFTQNAAAEEAQNLMSIDVLTKDQKKLVLEKIAGISFRSPYGREMAKYIKHGIGVHHAGLLPKYRILVERLAQDGLLKVISGTDTLGVGVNIPIRTVLFTKLCKFDGEKTAILSSRDFHQVSGRAGRKGFDDRGFVVAQAPEHVIENVKLERKAALDPKKAKKLVKAKPPERGFVHWDESTFTRLTKSTPEALQSRFQVNHEVVLSVLSRKMPAVENSSAEDGCSALRRLIRTSHETEINKRKHRKRAFQLFRSLLERNLITLSPLKVHGDLQTDFSLHQSLSLWMIDTLKHLDRESETYALDVVTLCEAIVESPDLIIRKQTDRARQALFLELKAEGVEFEERQERLEAVEHPKPLRDFIYQSFNEWSENHPWVGTENIRPKSIVREILENGFSFSDYIREYDLHRGEGVLLRTINDVYKVLVKTVPVSLKNDALFEIETELALMIRSVDSSLLDEWTRLKSDFVELGGKVRVAAGEGAAALDSGRLVSAYAPESSGAADQHRFDLRSVTRRLRVEFQRLTRALAAQDVEECVFLLSEWREWSELRPVRILISDEIDLPLIEIDEIPASFFGDALLKMKSLGFKGIRTDLKSRSPELLRVSRSGNVIKVENRILEREDEELHMDVVAEFEIRNQQAGS